MLAVELKIEDIYVPTDRRKELDSEKMDLAAETLLEQDEEKPILVRQDKKRYVLVKGIHRLEAHKALGEESIKAFVVSARRF